MHGSLLSMEPNDLIIHAWVSRSQFCEREQNPALIRIGIICFGLHQQS